MMAAVATGIYPDLAACARVWVEPTLGDTVAPDPALTALYDGLFPIYLSTRRAMPGNWRALAELRRA
jgi:erythritol kinase